MKIGQKVWTTQGILKRVVIKEIHSDPPYCMGLDGDGATLAYSFSNIHATSQAAKQACEEHAEYWQRRADEL